MRKRDITASHIVDAAFDLFATHGMDNTSLGMIAKQVGITKPSIYYHFATKEALISRIYEQLFSNHHFDTYFAEPLPDKEHFVQAIYEGGMRMLPVQGNEHHYTTLRVLNEYMMLAQRDEDYRLRLADMQQQFVGGFERLLRHGEALAVVASGNVQHKAALLALVIDSLSRSMMLQLALDYRGLWMEMVNSVVMADAKYSLSEDVLR